MRKLISWILGAILLLTMLIACGEKPCNVEGSIKVDNGQRYYCTDRGNGLRWYEN